MQIIHSDFRKGNVKLKIEDLDDLWYLSHLIDAGDTVKGKTTRKIKIGTEDSAKVVKKTVFLTIEVEQVEFHKYSDVLRVSGKVTDGPEDIPHGSYHTISLDVGTDFVLEKLHWLNYQKEKLQEAAEKKYNFLICVLDREEAIFALSKTYGFEIILELKGDVAKKEKQLGAGKDFYKQLAETIKIYNERYHPESIILASPAFFKEDVIKKVDAETKKKIVLATCSSVSENALGEVMKRPELKEALKKSRVRQEEVLVDELLAEINKDGLVVYGFQDVVQAVEAGAVNKLLVSDLLIQEKRRAGKFAELDKLMKQVDTLNGEVHIISEEHESGKKLSGLGGIAALLRYKLAW
ncbi:MAG: mRNA surveillance protein pelota [Candidatus Woesearchaeota archaeon]